MHAFNHITAAVPSYGNDVTDDEDDEKDDPDRTDVSQALYLSAPANSREASAAVRGGGGGRGGAGDEEEENCGGDEYRELSAEETEQLVTGALMQEIMDQTVGTLSKVGGCCCCCCSSIVVRVFFFALVR